jgi:hypothetical protein
MAEPIQCDNCGAILLEEDIFCGECGAPRPSVLQAPKQPATEPPDAAPPIATAPSPRTPRPPSSPQTGWRVATIVLGILGTLLCLLGLSAFLLFGLTESGDFTPEENWLYATFCCLLPIAGTGLVLALAGAGIWWARLRNR